jgi:hypothetical protein
MVAPSPASPLGRRGRRGPRIALGTVAGLVLAVLVAGLAFASVHMHLGDGIGDRRYQPTKAAALRDEYRLGIGNLRVDLSELKLPARPTTLHLHLGIGALHVVVPQGATVRTIAHVTWGEAELLGHREGGHNVRTDVGPAGARLVLDADVGIGGIEVTRSSLR